MVVPEHMAEVVGRSLAETDIDFTDARRFAGLGDQVTLLQPADTKGLEFDAVVVVEPSEIYGLGDSGPRLLYVVLTRAVQELFVVHAEPLPAILTPDDDLAA